MYIKIIDNILSKVMNKYYTGAEILDLYMLLFGMRWLLTLLEKSVHHCRGTSCYMYDKKGVPQSKYSKSKLRDLTLKLGVKNKNKCACLAI